ncbi:MAG: hypothetical protein WDN48_13285 [Pseudolabrys sp.]
MSKVVFAALIAAGLIAAPSMQSAKAQTPAATADKKETKKEAKGKKAPSPGQVAMRERQTKCAAEWKEVKAAGKVEKGMKWPQFWSACNKRLKGA